MRAARFQFSAFGIVRIAGAVARIETGEFGIDVLGMPPFGGRIFCTAGKNEKPSVVMQSLNVRASGAKRCTKANENDCCSPAYKHFVPTVSRDIPRDACVTEFLYKTEYLHTQ